ncbi:aminotransferase class V-fold PLP-dependent enzyme [Ruania halotolerans]|uniref:aminotransferase class V-fold PLP-dependent enzyme n=1 Tax=Ruania halotolerans TaxID=2897773 RepID=UPI001E29A2CF|nr:aminotransferase class V-fold PLP-dependent enzyme [Ruania halotolerans]UFU06376.1 aminotransferase class V-fold PLP-dependent enzyme [Ruania halotolerans]
MERGVMHQAALRSAASGVRLRSHHRARDAWPLDPEIVHLNHGSFGAVPTDVVRYQDELRAVGDRSPIGWYPRLAEYVLQARHEIAAFIGADAGDLAFVPNASAAATVVFNSLRLEAGEEILVTDHGYGAVTMGARRLARRFGASVRIVAIPLFADDEEVLTRFAAATSPRTRLIVVDQITSPTARRFPVAQIVAQARRSGVRVLVDGAHAPGLIDAPARCGEPDWWFGNLHKWPCAPRGAAVLVSAAADRDDLWPLIDSWAAEEPFPARFDTQGTIDATSYLAAPRAIAWMEREYGWAAARETMSELADLGAAIIGEAIAPHLDSEPVVMGVAPVPSMRLVRMPDSLADNREAADGLRDVLVDTAGVEAAFTTFDGRPYLRLSAHLYTEVADFHQFVERGIPLVLDAAGPARSARRPRSRSPHHTLEGEES